MPLRIKCPTGHTLIVPDDRAGRTLKCPRCDQSVVVPGGEADAASQALLSVLAEGIPAAKMAAGSLRVGPMPTTLEQSPIAMPQPPLDRPAIDLKARAPRARTPSLPAVKPKSRVLPPPSEAVSPSLPRQATEEISGPLQPAPRVDEPINTAAPQQTPEVNAADPPVLRAPDKEIAHAEPLPPVAIAPIDLPVESPTTPVSEQPTYGEPIAAPAVVEASILPPSEPAPEPPSELAEPLDQRTREESPLAQPLHKDQRFTEVDSRDEPDPAPPIVADEPLPPPFVPAAAIPVAPHLAADASRTLAAYQLAIALAAAALFSVVPAVWDLVEFLGSVESVFVARWAMAIFFLGVVQLAYAVYLFQLPDWSSVFVVTIFSLALAAVYAAVLGLVLLSPPDGLLVGESGLQLADKLAGGQAALWCLCMISLTTILAFFAGRLGASWHRAEMMLRLAAA